MKLVVVAVRDSAVNAYMRPFYVTATGQATRSFADEVNRTGSEMNAHPDDYELFELGTFEEETGVFEQLTITRSLARAKDVRIPTYTQGDLNETITPPRR